MTIVGQGRWTADNKSKNKDRCEENFSKARNRLGIRRNLLRTNAESEVYMTAGAGGRVAPLTHANPTPFAKTSVPIRRRGQRSSSPSCHLKFG